VTFLALVAVLRSVLLAGIAVGLNLLSVVTMFGVLSLLYSGSHPLLGRTGGVDVISIVSIFTITFALSIDYQVFLLARMREGYLESQDATTAIRFGVERTARIVTGAALIMLATFGAFATTQIANIQQIGVGLATAIAVDATVVRLVILPAVLRLGGARTWWLPDWLERKLPELDVEGFAYIRARTGQATRAADVS
jgi:RND superfamily putative drug exporter